MTLDDFSFIKDAALNGEPVEFSKRSKLNGAIRSAFTDCKLVLDPQGVPSFRSGVRFDFAMATMERCTIAGKGKLLKLNLTETVEFNKCKFIGGPFIEPRFGSGVLSNSRDVELLRECDFTECALHDARFYRVSIDQLKLPGWPFITVVARDGDEFYARPGKRPARSMIDDAVDAFQWDDDEMASAMQILVFGMGVGSYVTSVTVCHADDVARRGAGTPVRLKAALDRFAHPAIRY